LASREIDRVAKRVGKWRGGSPAAEKSDMPLFDRRQLLSAGAPLALILTGLGGRCGIAAEPAPPGEATFDMAGLRQIARSLAAKPYLAQKPPAPDAVSKIDFDVVQKIKFRPDRALWAAGEGRFPVRFFGLDKFNPLPVKINDSSGAVARAVVYSPQDFDFGDTGLAAELPADAGFSGFRVMNGGEQDTDWLAFQGASYFRSSGEDNQYGASARGVAVDTGTSRQEEFPRFVEFWLEQPDKGQPSITIFALLDGPSLTGAYRFVATKGSGAVIDIDAQLFIRNDINQLGIAPLTSMYWFGENDQRAALDWRPEIHDSDGLELWTGKGERIWRPLIDPPSLLVNSFLDENPKGFGLMQRDRDFDDYQDDGAFYNRRPSIWIEPKGDWGAGAVQLVEIPTQDEIHDNIVAYWKPKQPVKAGDEISLSYRLYWQNQNPQPASDTARIVATRIGRGGVPGKPAPTDKDSWKFVVDFTGGPLADMAPRFDVTPVVTLSRGKIVNPYVIKVVGTKKWRALFDVYAPGKERIDLRCFLRLEGKTLSETWLYQFFPPPGTA
jgi:glucans biosynthesis protein